jgi:hypothetical protein
MMTVSSTTNKVVIAGNASTTVFTYNFQINDAADAVVIYTDALGVSTTLSSTLYSISGLGVPTGGTVTYPLVGSPIAFGTSLTITRQLAMTQPTSISNQGAFYPSAVEAAIDRAVMEVQQVNELIGRTVTAPITDATAIGPLPGIAQRASKAFIFDAAGNPSAGAMPASGVISTAMQPVTSAASLAAGRTAFGLGAMAVQGIGAGLQSDGAGSARVNSAFTYEITGYSVLITDHRKQFGSYGANTFILPATSTLWNGFEFSVDSYAGAVTLTPNAADAIEGNATGVSSYIPIGGKATVYTAGAGSNAWSVRRIRSTFAPQTPGGYLSPSASSLIYGGDTTVTTIYYNADTGGYIPMYVGLEWVDFPFNQLSCALNATQQALNTIHDVFVILVSGVPTLVIGPAWGSWSGRGTGAGTTEIERSGYALWTNKYQMTAYNGATPYTVAAESGTYVGSILIDATAGQVTCHRAVGQSRKWGIWNAYNRKNIKMTESDPTPTWSYTTGTWRASHNDAANSCIAFCGLQEEEVQCTISQKIAATAICGVGYGWTTVVYGLQGASSLANFSTVAGEYSPAAMLLGAIYVYSVEWGGSGGTLYGGDGAHRLTVRYMG